MCADVVIVGGGPIGCWTAIQIKKRNPHLAVQIYERHPEYQRDHMLGIKRPSLTRYSHIADDDAERAFFAKLDALHSHVDAGPDTLSLRTLDFEDALKKECARLGVITAYDKIETPTDAMARHPECRLFVAADGARSAMRTGLLGDRSVESTHMFDSIDVTYQSRGNPRMLRTPTYNRVDDIITEYVGVPRDGIANVGLRLLVDDERYDAFEGATFKTPFTFASIAKMDDDLRKTNLISNFRRAFHLAAAKDEIEKFIELRKKDAGDDFIEGTERITRVKLARYASRLFAVIAPANDTHAAWFLAGDAAMGMPFFNSINSGLKQGSQLAAVLARPDQSPEQKVKAYESMRAAKLRQEFGPVAVKETGVKFYRDYARPVMRVGVITGAVTVGAAAVIAIGIPVYAAWTALWIVSLGRIPAPSLPRMM